MGLLIGLISMLLGWCVSGNREAQGQGERWAMAGGLSSQNTKHLSVKFIVSNECGLSSQTIRIVTSKITDHRSPLQI